MLPLVIDVVPDTNSRKDIYPSVTSAVRPLLLNLTLATNVLKQYTAPRPIVLAAVK